MAYAAAAFDAGHITMRHIELLGQCLAPNYEGAFIEAEEYLVDAAVDLDWDSFYRVITQWKNAADTAEPDLCAARTDRPAQSNSRAASTIEASSAAP
jgi:hypothetical protein